MKSIATITFHWAKNYGAVLQAYALQKYLIKSGFNTEIINYLPLRTAFANNVTAIKKKDFAFFRKANSFKHFRKNELVIGKKKYYSNKALFSCKDKYSAIIAGSDQIWNMSFTKKAEGKPTLSYYLNFAGANTKRISYAASFGTNRLDESVASLITPELKRYSAISVRENSAAKMLAELGINAACVLDPTLLLDAEDYAPLVAKCKSHEKETVFTYIIHSNQTAAKEISRYVCDKFSPSTQKHINGVKDCGIYEWLYKIKNADFVVTNSFHGTAFSLIFHKPFITVAVPKSGMNDRITTLLDAVGLSHRFLNEFNSTDIDTVLNDDIDWQKVDNHIRDMKTASEAFLTEALKG